MRPKRKILLVHHDVARVEELRFLLTTRGHRVAVAESVEEALAELEGVQYFPAYTPKTLDLLMVELGVPGALELVSQAKRLQPAMPVLLTSDDVMNHPAAVEAEAYLPDSPAELLDAVNELTLRKRGPRRAVPMTLEVLAGRRA